MCECMYVCFVIFIYNGAALTNKAKERKNIINIFAHIQSFIQPNSQCNRTISVSILANTNATHSEVHNILSFFLQNKNSFSTSTIFLVAFIALTSASLSVCEFSMCAFVCVFCCWCVFVVRLIYAVLDSFGSFWDSVWKTLDHSVSSSATPLISAIVLWIKRDRNQSIRILLSLDNKR